MSFFGRETSRDSGRPIYLIEAFYGNRAWRYTTSELAVTFGGDVYLPRTMKIPKFKDPRNVETSSADITMPMAGNDLADVFKVHPPSEVVGISVYKLHHLDGEHSVEFSGRIVNANWQPPSVVLTCENEYSSMRRTGLRRRFSTQCQHPLFSPAPQCSLDAEDWRQVLTVTAVTALTVTLAGATAFADDWFAGGKITWLNADYGNVESRGVRESVQSTGELLLMASTVGLAPGMVVAAYPGCDHTIDTCHTKFDNALNHGNVPYRPTKNPFGGTTLY